ncbi:MAG TPA: HemK/PrmC family methyltransferase [Verrucomicrobiae bacterium]|nr:HemK/PrmC family methyltransferase [Verrucomicrobiae bacterium]
MSILEIIERSADFLAKRGVASPRLQVELLLAHVLKMPRMKLYLSFERLLTDSELDALRPLVQRRSQREPLQYIIGSTSFCGIEIAVDRRVLIPRPETELLAERAWTFLNRNPAMGSATVAARKAGISRIVPSVALAGVSPASSKTISSTSNKPESDKAKVFGGTPKTAVETTALPNATETFLVKEQGGSGEDAPVALDLCTGSGCVAIALALHATTAKIHATDNSKEALALAAENAQRHGTNIHFHEGDLFSAIPSETRFDLIISNPPYIPSNRIDSLETEVRDFEPRAALDGGNDGLDFYRRISAQARDFLKPDGRLMLELDEDGAEATREIFLKDGWAVEALEMDYNRQPRILIANPRST